MQKVGLGVVAMVLSACTFSASTALGTGRTGGGGGGSERRAIAMPNLILMSQAEAEEALRRAGFTRGVSVDNHAACGSTLEDQRTVVELGRVCYQHPSPGRETSTTLPVSIRVQTENPWRGDLSGGRFWFLMPDFAGVHVDAARAKLRELGFTSKDVKIAYTDECKPDLVCKTFPSAFTRADNTSDKLFYVGRSAEQPAGKPATTTTTTTPPPDIF